MVKKKAKSRWEPTNRDLAAVLTEQSPWDYQGEVSDVLAPKIERPMAQCLWQRLKTDEPRRFQLILGPRRVGKTTAMYQTVRHLLTHCKIPPFRLSWLRLDHPILIRKSLDNLVNIAIQYANELSAENSLGKISKKNPLYLFLDELTYAKDWDLWLKTFYDDNWPVRILATSSSTAAMRDRKLESGVGRWDEQYLAPYLLTEYLELVGQPVSIPVASTFFETIEACCAENIEAPNLNDLRRRFMLTGGFPELLSQNVNPVDEASALLQSQRTLRNDAVERAIYKDIPQAYGVDKPMLLERLLYSLAGQLAGVLSPATICQGLDGMSQPTFDRYLSYLEKAFLVFTLPNYSGSELSVQRRGRKLYFVDGAVRNAALQRGIGPLKNETEAGLLTENMAAGHMHALSQQSLVRLYHWRDKGDEVDLIYDHPEQPMAFEISVGAQHHHRGLSIFSERYKRFQGRCFVVAPNLTLTMPNKSWDGIGTIPLDIFLIAASAQVAIELKNNLSSGGKRANG